MGKKQRVTVTKEDGNGRNLEFHDNITGDDMSRRTFVSKIKAGENNYNQLYYVRKQNGIETPVSKPDGNKSNNLG